MPFTTWRFFRGEKRIYLFYIINNTLILMCVDRWAGLLLVIALKMHQIYARIDMLFQYTQWSCFKLFNSWLLMAAGKMSVLTHMWPPPPSLSVQMHHPIQMKPADSEKNNGEWLVSDLWMLQEYYDSPPFIYAYLQNFWVRCYLFI